MGEYLQILKIILLKSADLTPYWRHESSAERKESNTESCLQNSPVLTSSDKYLNAGTAKSAKFWNGVLTTKRSTHSQRLI